MSIKTVVEIDHHKDEPRLVMRDLICAIEYSLPHMGPARAWVTLLLRKFAIYEFDDDLLLGNWDKAHDICVRKCKEATEEIRQRFLRSQPR